MAKDTAIAAMLKIADVIEETAREAGSLGAPSGMVYAALMGIGVTLEVYNSIISAMVNTGRIRIASDCLIAVGGQATARVDW